MINRFLQPQLESLLGSRKAIILMGARQVGKSTLLQLLLGQRQDVHLIVQYIKDLSRPDFIAGAFFAE